METNAPSSVEFSAPVSVVEAAAGGDATAPKVPTFSMLAYTGGPMMISGFRFPVVVDLTGMSLPTRQAPIRMSHDRARPVGHTNAVSIVSNQLHASGVLSFDNADTRSIVGSAKNGFEWQASIGASIQKMDFLKDGEKAVVNGQEITGPANLVRASTLNEISFVDLGADPKTSATVAATAAPALQRESSTMENTASATAATQNGTVTASATDGAIQASRAAMAAETNRVSGIRSKCGGKHSTIEAQAILEGWTVEKTELEVMRAERPNVANIISANAPENSLAVVEAAIAQTGKMPNLEKQFSAQNLEAAHRQFRGRIGLGQAVMVAAWNSGKFHERFLNAGNIRSALEAAFSSNDFGTMLSNLANKFLLEQYNSLATLNTWRNVAAIRPANDFKTQTRYRLNGSLEYQKVSPSGQLKHGSLGTDSYTNKVETFGVMLGLPRTDIINDDLGAFTQIPQKLAIGGAQALNKVIWSTFLANTDFFTAARGNYQEGAGTVLSLDSAIAAELLFMSQTDGDGTPLGILPTQIVVPPALAAKAEQLYKSAEIRDTTSSTKYGTTNIMQNKYRPVVVPHLSLLPGGSSTAWYLVTDPMILAAIEVAFLNGNESPVIESAEADFDSLGIQMRAFHDFGAALAEYRAGIKSKGAA